MTKTVVAVDLSLLKSIDGLTPSKRLLSLRKRFFDEGRHVASERARLAMESWKETEGDTLQLRHARKLKKILEGVPVVIFPGELLVGSQTKYFRGGNPQCDYDGSLLGKLMAEGRITLGGPEVVGIHTDIDWKVLAEAAEYFKGKTAADAVKETRHAVMGDWYDDLADAGGVQRSEGYPAFVGVPYFEKILNIGLRGIINQCESQIYRFKEARGEDLEALEFWQSAIISCEAAITLSRRYAALASEMARAEADPARRAELERISEVCNWVPENPARTFHEALQCMVMVDLALCLESPSSGVSGWGTVDQHWYPYFKKDIEERRLTVEQAADFIGCAITYSARRERVSEITWRDYFQIGLQQSFALGGPTRDGKGDVSNELSYMVLHVAGMLGYSEPHIPLRWHEGTPRWLMHKAIETNCKVHGGVPQFQNTDHIVRVLTSWGVSPESARDWQSDGCSQAEPSDQRTSLVPTYFNIALPVNLVLHDGTASAIGKKVGIETGDPRRFKTFDEFYNAFKKQTEFMMQGCLWHANIAELAKARHWLTPLSSSVLPGCIEKGRDYMRGGLPHYKNWNMKDRGLIPAADSLMAVKKLVFEEKKLTMDELIKALDSNFAGERGEDIRKMCLAAPKYGNDVDEADFLVRDIGKFTAGIIRSTKNIFGYPYSINRNGQSWHFANGKKIGALPSGRKAKEPLPDGSLSPMQGLDSKGPTAVLNSALKADFKEGISGILNMRFPGQLFEGQDNRNKLIDLVQGYFGAGGTYIQFNILDRQTLLNAKSHPEDYKDLVVRVGGYSAYFVNLSPEVQDELIRRTEQSF